jgi:polar amino acid transport system substrate-binding protein
MKKTISILLSLALFTTLLTACGGTSSTSQSSSTENQTGLASADSAATETESAQTGGYTGEVRTIVAATSGGPKPLIYTDDDDQLTGHNVELLKAVFDRLPQYELELVQVSDLGSILTGVNSGIYQLGFNNLAKNEEREKLVQYTDPIMVNDYLVVVNKDVGITEFNGLEDLAGLNFVGTAGNDKTTVIEDWNAANPDKEIIINYTSADIVSNLQDVEAGRYDCYIIDAPMFNAYYQVEYGFDVDTFSLKGRTSTKYSYFVVAQGDDQLLEDVNNTLAEVFADGTSTEICEKYLGADYTPGIADQ